MTRSGSFSVVLVLAASACAGGNAASSIADMPRIDTARCLGARGHERPLIVEWPSSDRAAIESAARRGVIAVRYTGCSMRVLPRCTAGGAYRYTGVTRKSDRLAIQNADQLYANLQLGAAQLEGKIARGDALAVDLTIVGQLDADRAPRTRASLQGPESECALATHVVEGITVGAFDFYAGSAAEIAAGYGVRATSTARRETLAQDGSAAACASATPGDTRPPDQCGAFMRVEVTPIEGEAPPPLVVPSAVAPPPPAIRCPPGLHFEPGRGCLPDVIAPSAPAIACPAGMIFHPGGAFDVGSNDGQYEREEPLHSATVSPFCLDATEVTVAAYAACARAGACPPPATTIALDRVLPAYRAFVEPMCNGDRRDRANHPANCVDLHQAEALCRFRGARLPNELEWEFAARGGDQARSYPWGDERAAPDLLNACGRECSDQFSARGDWSGVLYEGRDAFVSTAPVGSFPRGASRWGVQDLAGNVEEWTSSPACSYRKYGCEDPRRVVRGGDFFTSHFADARGSYRAHWDPATRLPQIGFRCAR